MLGYCITPLVLSCLLLRLVSVLVTHVWVRLVVVGLGFAWAVYGAPAPTLARRHHFPNLIRYACVWAPPASMGFLADSGPPSRKALVVYPTLLFYVVISWLILNDVRTEPAADPAAALTSAPTLAPTLAPTAAHTN